MAIDAFVIRDVTEGIEFAELFLKSPDFDHVTLREICKDLKIRSTGKKQMLVNRITSIAERHPEEVYVVSLENLLNRRKKWLSIQQGDINKIPECSNPLELMFTVGEEKWYGPIRNSNDREANWYIRPIYVSHWEKPAGNSLDHDGQLTNQPQQYLIRWLCFARIVSGTISIHWQGFSHMEMVENIQKNNSQNRYWEYVPALFHELESLTNSRYLRPALHELILQKLWDQYRRDKANYSWQDLRIRAEAGGVSLNARTTSSGSVDLDIKGIHRLAHTLRRSIEVELNDNYSIQLPDPEEFDEVLLRTLIHDFGALSYEFELEDKEEEILFRGHVYFGAKPNHSSSDSFPHMNLHVTYKNDLEQLDFLLRHLEDYHGENDRSGQLSLL